jgi:hypothetical protein
MRAAKNENRSGTDWEEIPEKSLPSKSEDGAPNVNGSLLDEVFVSAWRQALVESKKIVTVGDATYPVRRTARHHLAQVDFEFGGQAYRGLEQNRQTKSRWAQMARGGAKVMQFLQAGQYVGVVADGILKYYGRKVGEG